eukprot:2426076-Amphidinium_carterae.1
MEFSIRKGSQTRNPMGNLAKCKYAVAEFSLHHTDMPLTFCVRLCHLRTGHAQVPASIAPALSSN